MKWHRINESSRSDTRKLVQILNNYGFEQTNKNKFTKTGENGARAEISLWSDIPQARGTISMGSGNRELLSINAHIDDIEDLTNQISDALGMIDEIKGTLDSHTEFLTRYSKKRKWMFRTMY